MASSAVTANGPSAVSATLLEQVVVQGDLAKLSPSDRVHYYQRVCESLNLNPLTSPFQYITLNNRLTLYATRGATDQLRKVHGVNITGLVRERMEDLYVVTATAKDADGRTDESIGAVSTKGLAGEALANAFMKAETKAKRRVTLSIVGLGWLDESEVEGVADARTVVVDQETGEIHEEPQTAQRTVDPKKLRAATEQRYDRLSEKADALDIPHKTRSFKWTDDELGAEGAELLAKIRAKEASIGNGP